MDTYNYGSFRHAIIMTRGIKKKKKKDPTFVPLVKLTSIYMHINLDTYLTEIDLVLNSTLVKLSSVSTKHVLLGTLPQMIPIVLS